MARKGSFTAKGKAKINMPALKWRILRVNSGRILKTRKRVSVTAINAKNNDRYKYGAQVLYMYFKLQVEYMKFDAE